MFALTLVRLIDVFPVHVDVGEAAWSAGCSWRAASRPAGSPLLLTVT